MAHPSEIVNTKGHWAVGVKWPVIGSKGDASEQTVTGSSADAEDGLFGIPRWGLYLAAAVAAGLVIAFAPASGT